MNNQKVYDHLVSGAEVWFYDKNGNARKARYSSRTLYIFDHSNKVIYEAEKYNVRKLSKFADEITKHLVGTW
jgi:hypothetical protein